MSVSQQRDIGAYLKGANALDANTVTAGGAGDGAEQDGNYVDRSAPYLSCKLVISWTAVLAQDATLTLAANLQDAVDAAGTGVADYGDALAAAVVATGGTGGSTEKGVTELDIDLSSARGFVRAQITPTLSAASIDTVAMAAVLVFGGGDTFPLT